MISTLVSLPYEIARFPLAFVNQTLSDKVPEDSAPKVALDRAIGTADRLAGRLTGNRALASRGAERLDRLDKIVTAAKLDQQAAARREEAAETARAGHDDAAAKLKAAERKAESAIFESEAVETRGKRKAKVEAAKTATTKKQAADQRAVKVVETAEQAKKRAEAAAEARRKTQLRKAEAKAKDARESQEAAAEARADAEQLSDLTEAKKQERKQD